VFVRITVHYPVPGHYLRTHPVDHCYAHAGGWDITCGGPW